jgi:hypothetical protein
MSATILEMLRTKHSAICGSRAAFFLYFTTGHFLSLN